MGDDFIRDLDEYFCKTFIHRYGISPKQLRRNVDDAKE